MALSKNKVILGKTDDYSLRWIGAPQGGGKNPFDDIIKANRAKVVVYGTIEDDSADYSYDDWALIKLKGQWALLNTTGCSCPSPDETWATYYGPHPTLNKLIKEFHEKAKYGIQINQAGQFEEVFEYAKSFNKKKAK